MDFLTRLSPWIINGLTPSDVKAACGGGHGAPGVDESEDERDNSQ